MLSERYNRSLSLILESDRNNKDKIINFINDIPNDLLRSIDDKLCIYQEYLSGKRSIYDSDVVFCLSDNVIVDNECLYSFIIDMVADSITITKSKKISDGLLKESELVLYVETTYNSVFTLGKQSLGIFNHMGTKVNYELINTFFGLIVVSSNGGILNRYKWIKNVDCLVIDSVSNIDSYARLRRK